MPSQARLCVSLLSQRADAQSERLSRELRGLRDERSELLGTASALRRDNDRQAAFIRHIQGTWRREPGGCALQKPSRDKENTPKPAALRAAHTQGSVPQPCHKSCGLSKSS